MTACCMQRSHKDALSELPSDKPTSRVTCQEVKIEATDLCCPLTIGTCWLQRKASETMDGMTPADFRKSGTFPQRHRISEQFPVVITPSEQVSEEVSHHLRLSCRPASHAPLG